MRRRACAVLCCLFAAPAYAALNVAPGTPRGFETLDAPRATYVTLSYGAASLGSFPAHVSPSEITLDRPGDVLAAIGTITDRQKVQLALSGPLAPHAESLCRKGNTVDCGTLHPDIAALIFDEATLTAELFINPHFLGLQDGNGPRYLALPDRHPSSIYGFSGAVAGTGQTDPNFALSTDAAMAYGEGRLLMQTTVSNEGLRFDTAAASIDRQGWEGEAGLFRSRALQLIPDRDIAGISIGTSMRTRLDVRKIEGNAILLYLPRRAIVSVYREGRLYSSRAYEAGNQAIDTSELPEGAYSITLKIQEQDGAMREETRFFAKSPDIPPPGEPTYYLQAGVLRKPATSDSTIPELTDHRLLRAGSIRRIDDNIGMTTDGMLLDDRAITELGGFFMHGGSQLHITGLASTKGDTGAQFSLLTTSGRWSLAADARALWSDTPMSNDTDPIISSYQQATATLTYAATTDLTLGLRATASDQNHMRQSAYGPTVNWYLWREGENILSFDTDAGRSNGDTVGNAFLRFTMRFGEYGVSSTGGYASGNGAVGGTANARVWRDTITPESERLLGAGLQHDSHTTTASVDGDYRNSFGRVRGLVQQSAAGGDGITSYNGNFSFNAAQLDDDVYLGGDHADMSAVIVSLDGDAEVPMKIMVGSVEHGQVLPGSAQTVYLAPYQEYMIRLVPKESGLLNYENGARNVTLYPGNVRRLHWRVDHFYVVLARLVDTDGAPLSNAMLQEGDGQASTNAKGRLQVQLTHPERLTFITAQNNACEATLPQQSPVNGVIIYRKPLVCQPIPLG